MAAAADKRRSSERRARGPRLPPLPVLPVLLPVVCGGGGAGSGTEGAGGGGGGSGSLRRYQLFRSSFTRRTRPDLTSPPRPALIVVEAPPSFSRSALTHAHTGRSARHRHRFDPPPTPDAYSFSFFLLFFFFYPFLSTHRRPTVDARPPATTVYGDDSIFPVDAVGFHETGTRFDYIF